MNNNDEILSEDWDIEGAVRASQEALYALACDPNLDHNDLRASLAFEGYLERFTNKAPSVEMIAEILKISRDESEAIFAHYKDRNVLLPNEDGSMRVNARFVWYGKGCELERAYNSDPELKFHTRPVCTLKKQRKSRKHLLPVS